MNTDVRRKIFDFYGVDNLDELLDQEDYQFTDSVVDSFCLSCGEYCGGVEPDARDYYCEHCGDDNVSSLVEIFIF